MPARFVMPALGFANGWSYWTVWALTFPAEMAGIASLMQYWVTVEECPSWVWSLVYMIPLVSLNLFAVTGYAEAEFGMCIVKIFAIVLFLLIGTFVWFGVGQGTGPLWFTNWNPAIVGDTSLIRFINIGSTFITAFFSYGGTELVGVTAGEAANPRLSVPRAINGTFYRIVIFYLLSLFLVGVLLAPDSEILQASSIKESPFVYAYNQAGIAFGADFMNFIIIVSASSAANSALYACARTLLRLSQEGNAPQIFAKVDRRGVPVNSVLLVAMFGHKTEELPYVAPFYPYADVLSLSIGSFVTVLMVFSAFFTNGEDSATFFNLQWWLDHSWIYFGAPLILALFLCHGIFKSGFSLVKYEDMDFETGRLIETAEQREENDRAHARPKNLKEWGQKIWFKLF
ncbi:hypothetical protein HDU98_011271 [Podochytrium sp. JEL0797]|nr:hypothetical protein HDU98_011271 [Podochytrium sp. JEL0797]